MISTLENTTTFQPLVVVCTLMAYKVLVATTTINIDCFSYVHIGRGLICKIINFLFTFILFVCVCQVAQQSMMGGQTQFKQEATSPVCEYFAWFKEDS